MSVSLGSGARRVRHDPADRTAVRDAPPPRSPPDRRLVPTLLALFFVSGACGLVYQQLWLRELSLVFGVTVYAVATVLAAFFSGLALGSFLAGRYVDRTARPLHWYGLVEILVGVTALATPLALDTVERVYVDLADVLPDSTATLTAARFVLSFAVLLLPATLLGASLPIIVKSSVLRSSGLGERASLLYATNAAGAIVGVLVAGFWLIGRHGVLFSFRAAAAANVAVGVMAIMCSRAWEGRTGPRAAPRPSERGRGEGRDTLIRGRGDDAGLVLAVFTVSGFVALALEIVWFRVLVLHLVRDTYAFTIMLATVLAGITLGSYVAASVLRRRVDYLRLAAAAELAVALTAVLSFWLLSRSYDLAERTGGLVDVDERGLRFAVLVSLLAILPTTLLMGFAFPVGLRAFAGEAHTGDETGRRVGVFYACNVAGGIAGSVTGGFVLLPGLGSRRTLLVLAGLLLASGLVLALRATRSHVRLAMIGGGTTLFLVAAIAGVPDPLTDAVRHRYPGQHLLWSEEGAQSTVSIHALPDGKRGLFIDGLPQASDYPFIVSYHRLIGTLPVALHADPERALVIGLGSGVTAGAVGAYPGIDVDVVELSSGVVDGAEFFTDVNDDVVDQPNVDIRRDDGRNHLLTTDERYDVITADIIVPEHAGAGKLWSVEYWELTRDALADDGIMLQWLPSSEPATFEMIMRSFLRVYPDATLWRGRDLAGADAHLLVGTKEPLHVSIDDIERKLARPGTRAVLAAADITDIASLAALYTAGPREMMAFVGEGPVLTDDRPRLEYFRSQARERSSAEPSPVPRGDVGEVLRP